MRTLTLTEDNPVREVILEQSCIDFNRAILTVVNEPNYINVSISRKEAIEISEWLEDFLEQSR